MSVPPDVSTGELSAPSLHFDQARQVGIVFHMMSALTERGRIGLTAVGDTVAEAEATYARAERLLVEEGGIALASPPLPPVEAGRRAGL